MKEQLAIQRAQQKSSEGEFLHELQTSYELSPKLSEEILRSAKGSLFRSSVGHRSGQVDVTVIGIEERSGKMVERMEKKTVCITIDDGVDDIEIVRDHGRTVLRQVRIDRITEEAIEQGGILSQEDLSRYLLTSLRTIKRDIAEMKGRGIEVITRGVLHNIGRGQTHKVKIVGQYLEGMTYSELRRKTRHSLGAIKRYVDHFTKVVMAAEHGLKGAAEISQVTGLSVFLVGQYQALMREVRRDSIKRSNLMDLIERAKYRPEIKKRPNVHGKRVVRTMEGGRV